MIHRCDILAFKFQSFIICYQSNSIHSDSREILTHIKRIQLSTHSSDYSYDKHLACESLFSPNSTVRSFSVSFVSSTNMNKTRDRLNSSKRSSNSWTVNYTLIWNVFATHFCDFTLFYVILSRFEVNQFSFNGKNAR